MLIFMFLSLAMPFTASMAGLVVSPRAVPQHALAVLDPLKPTHICYLLTLALVTLRAHRFEGT
jgi:hypothetical protein